MAIMWVMLQPNTFLPTLGMGSASSIRDMGGARRRGGFGGTRCCVRTSAQ